MEAAHALRKHVGEILLEQGLLTQDELDRALARQRDTRAPLGHVLVELGYVSPGAMANALAEQHGGLLRTEYGISLGLRPGAGRRAQPVPRAAPQPEPQADLLAPWRAALAERDARLVELAEALRLRDARIQELETALRTLERHLGDSRATAA